MTRRIWRHTLTMKEQRLWNKEEMKGWRESMIGCVEDDARENGCKKFMVYDRNDTVLAKDVVTPLPVPEPVETA